MRNRAALSATLAGVFTNVVFDNRIASWGFANASEILDIIWDAEDTDLASSLIFLT